MKVQLLITCIVDTLFPAVGEAMVAVLERLGVTVEFPAAQTCCGQPAMNSGFRAEAQAVAEHWLRVFADTEGYIVAPSGSCVAMVRHLYPELFHDQPARLAQAQALAGRTFEFSEFLVDVLKVTPAQLNAHFPGTLTYHPSCHLSRFLGVASQPRQLLAGVSGAQVTPLPQAEECCGFGGVFAVKHGELSGAMLARKLAAVQASGAATLVGCDMSCLMHIAGGLSRAGSAVQCQHLAQVLAATAP